MDNQKAKEILSAYRPSTDDAADPFIAEALEVMRRNSGLIDWFEQQCALDKAIRNKLGEIEVPSDLEEKILSSQKVTPIRSGERRFAWFAPLAAAAAVAAITGLWIANMATGEFNSYRAEMVEYVSEEYDVDPEVHSLDALRKIFAERSWPSGYIVPAGLLGVELEGGVAKKWEGSKVSLICHEYEEHKDIWLFVIEVSDLEDAPETDAPQFAKIGRMTTASWTQGIYTYLMVAERDQAFLKKYL